MFPTSSSRSSAQPLHSPTGSHSIVVCLCPECCQRRYKYFPPFLLPPSSSFLLHPTPTHSHTPTTTHTLVRPIHPPPSHLPTALSHAHFIFSPPLDGALMAFDAVGALTADRASRRVSSALPMRPLHSNSPVLSCTSSPSAIYLTGLLPAALKRTHC